MKPYEKLELEVIAFETEDVIMTSSDIETEETPENVVTETTGLH